MGTQENHSPRVKNLRGAPGSPPPKGPARARRRMVPRIARPAPVGRFCPPCAVAVPGLPADPFWLRPVLALAESACHALEFGDPGKAPTGPPAGR
jgi:hypothetical protein